MNRLRDRWDRDLTADETVTEKGNVAVFDGSNPNPVTKMLKYLSENYEGDRRTYNDKDGDEINSSYRLLLVAHNASGFHRWVVLNFLNKERTVIRIIKTARRLLSIPFWCGVEIVISVEVPQKVKFTGTESHIRVFTKNP